MFVGYHDDHKLPYRAGSTIQIPAGINIHTTRPAPNRELVARRNRSIRIHHFRSGRSVTKSYLDYYHGNHFGVSRNALGEPLYAVENPEICWVGTGGYWHWVDLNRVVGYHLNWLFRGLTRDQR